ncbi:MAG: GAF domain-containing sensor histidine kinase [Candidatus Krumholzibacteriales bacterium]
MPLTEKFNIPEKIGDPSSTTLISFLRAADEAIRDVYGEVAATAVKIKAEKLIAVLNSSGLNQSRLDELIGLEEMEGYRRRIYGSNEKKGVEPEKPALIEIPLRGEGGRLGSHFILTDQRSAESVSASSREELAGVLSLEIRSRNRRRYDSIFPVERDGLRLDFIEGINDSGIMRSALTRALELADAQFCAFFTESGQREIHIMLEGKELAGLVPEISRKTVSSYNHFVNRPGCPDAEYREKVYYMGNRKNIHYLIGSLSIGSYFLVPVVSGLRVRGILFVGSIRKNSFTRSQVSSLRGLAGEDIPDIQVVYRRSSEKELVDKLLESTPLGAAIISSDGEILYENRTFGEYLNAGNCRFQTLDDVSAVAGYDFRDLMAELKILKKEIRGKVLEPSGRSGRPLKVFWTGMKDLIERADSLLMITPAGDWETGAAAERIALISHEIRTPLSALKNSLSLLSRDRIIRELERNAGEGSTTAADIFSTALRTLRRLNYMLDSFDIRPGSVVAGSAPNPGITHLSDLIETVSALYRKQMQSGGIEFSVHMEKGLESIETDSGRLEQILHNLLSNSLKSGGNRVDITVSRTAPPENSILSEIPWNRIREPEIVEITVADDGKGFSPEVVEYINELSENELNPDFGLGLFISAALAKSMGAVLRVENRERGGAACSVFLPSDTDSMETSRKFNEISRRLEKMKKLGKVPILYIVGKEDDDCWLALAEKWKDIPTFSPGSGQDTGSDFCFWPLSSEIGIGLARGGEYLPEPERIIHGTREGLSLVGDGVSRSMRIGWSICSDSNCGIRSLLREAAEKFETGIMMTV